MTINLAIVDNPAALPIIAGAVLLLFGWLLYRTILTVAGGVLGAAIGYGIARFVADFLIDDASMLLIAQAAGALIGLIAGILIFHWMHRAAFFILGAVFGGWAFAEAFFIIKDTGLGSPNEIVFAAGIAITALVAGMLFVLLNKYIIALVSAGAGTLLIMGAGDWPHEAIITIPLFVIGFLLQLRLASFGRKRHDEDDE